MNRRGISMISLVIIIIVTIILIGVATTAGYRYLEEANQLKAKTLGSLIGMSAGKRQNDLYSGIADKYYEGYYVDIEKLIENKGDIKYFPEEIKPDEHSGELWYIVDAEAATDLGSDGAEGLLTRNISPLLYNNSNDTIKVVLVEYISGSGYYVAMPATVAKDALVNAETACPHSPDGNHKYTIATCVDRSVCIYCGTFGPNALGHKWVAATCTAGGYCERCGAVNPDEPDPLGHRFISDTEISNESSDLMKKITARNCFATPGGSIENYEAWISDVEKHWHECIRCEIRKGEEVHFFAIEGDKQFIADDSSYHHQECKLCGWTSIKSKHDIEITLTSDNMHLYTCKLCNYSDNHSDSGWQPDHPQVHYRYCLADNDCNKITITINGVNKNVLITEEHYDNDHDYYCDVCGRGLDTNPPLDFGIEDGDITTYARVKKVNGVPQITTNTIVIEAYTIDKETRIDYYQFGIKQPDGTIKWLSESEGGIVRSSGYSMVAEHTYTGLEANRSYTFYARAFDLSGNVNAPYPVIASTGNFPNFNGLKDVPDPYVKSAVIGVNEVVTDMTGLYVEYRQNDGTWSTPVLLENIDNIKITLTEEVEVIDLKFVDSVGNESEITEYEVAVIDNIPPDVSITGKSGDDYSQETMQHYAVVTISDEKAGIAPNTDVKYGWSTTKTVEPESFVYYKTENVSNVPMYSFDAVTPSGVSGTFYLWVMKGTKDAAENATTVNTISTIGFVIDDVRPEVTNIKMFNATPAVPGQDLFVKTGGTVTVTFSVSKVLKDDPKVCINDINMLVNHSGLNYTCTLEITDNIEEGNLQLFIGDVVSLNGRTALNTYNNTNLQYGPVYYDKTNPLLQYSPKKDMSQ